MVAVSCERRSKGCGSAGECAVDAGAGAGAKDGAAGDGDSLFVTTAAAGVDTGTHAATTAAEDMVPLPMFV